jgi:hypothetical protein
MLVGIKRAEAVDTPQGGKQPGLQAAPKRLLAVMQPGTGIARMRLLIGLSRLRELRHHRGEGRRLVEPMGQHLHTDARQTGRHRDQLALRRSCFVASLLGAAARSLDCDPRPSATDCCDGE